MSRKHLILMVAAAALAAACAEPTSIPEPEVRVLSSQTAVKFWEAGETVAWNAVARDLVVKYSTGGIPAIRVFTLLSIAQYNAIVAAEDGTDGSMHPSSGGAVAGASAAVLAYLYPSEVAFLEGTVDQREAAPQWPGSRHEDFAAGEAIGRSTAVQVVAHAQQDRFFAPFTGTVPICPGCWLAVPTPPAFATLGQARTFFLTSGSQFRPPPPPAFGSPEFLAGLAEVRQIADTRTAAQDAIAKFWALPAGTISPQGYWNRLGSELAVQYRLTERATAHGLALMNMAAYDAIIASHEAKFTYWLIRPSQADPLINLAIGMPSFPSYPSNHATVSAASTTVLGALFPSERQWLNAQAEEAAISRVFGGIHYRFDCEAGLALGRTIGRYVLDHDVVGHTPFVVE
jgi:membrane-associated phospholipid phosphatase